jgi:hypothetical protein
VSYRKAMIASAKQQAKNERTQAAADAATERRERRKVVKRVTRRIRGGQKCHYCRREAAWTDNTHGVNVCDNHRNQLEG